MKNSKTKELIESIHSRVKNFVSGSDYINYLKFIKKFRKRSFFNQMLIWITKENSTFVMGYKQWIDKFNRIPVACVICRSLSNKNCECEERTPPVRIPQLAPITYKYEDDKTGEDKEGIYFKTVYVFDISDTEPLPDLPIKEVFDETFDLGIEKLDVEVQFEKLEPVFIKIIVFFFRTLYIIIPRPTQINKFNLTIKLLNLNSIIYYTITFRHRSSHSSHIF
jgi:hypothetical protein